MKNILRLDTIYLIIGNNREWARRKNIIME